MLIVQLLHGNDLSHILLLIFGFTRHKSSFCIGKEEYGNSNMLYLICKRH